MKKHLSPFLPAVVAGIAASAPAIGQVQPVAFESFDYAFPNALGGLNGGTGWPGPWWAGANTDDVVIQQNNAQNPFPFSGADSVGNYAQMNIEFGGGYRMPDAAAHPDITVNGLFGKDGTTMWFSFTTVNFQSFGDHYGGFSLFEQFVGEKLFMGSPWASYGWGLDDQTGSADVIPNTDDTVVTRFVVRIDYLAGDERCRVYLNPAVPHPTGPADLDVMINDHVWNECRISSGGSGSLYYWDNIVIEKGEPAGTIGTNYCGPVVPNSTGLPGVIAATGSLVAADNDVTLTAYDLPPNQFGYFLNSMTQASTFPVPNSQGVLCIGGAIGRYNGSAFNSGSSGTGMLVLDLTNTPTPSGTVTIVAGQTWNFTCWYRDDNPGPTSNFTDATELPFL